MEICSILGKKPEWCRIESKTQDSPGELIVVATPIGNLGDFSSRAIQALQNSDLILTEDTRSFSTLQRKFQIETPVKSYFEHNEKARALEVLEDLKRGKRIALVSEAGTPAVSDPGYRIVRACRENGLRVSGVPGPSAALLALSISGLPSDRFLFQGFLPQRPGRRSAMIRTLLESGTTAIIFESPYRILKTLSELAELEAKRELFVGRELTKLHEECFWGTAEDVLRTMQQKASIKGEIVLIVSGRGGEPIEEESDE